MTFKQSDIIFLPLASICTELKLTIKFMTLFFIVSGVTAIGTALSENGGLLNHYFKFNVIWNFVSAVFFVYYLLGHGVGSLQYFRYKWTKYVLIIT